jgi:penicillin G amidase
MASLAHVMNHASRRAPFLWAALAACVTTVLFFAGREPTTAGVPAHVSAPVEVKVDAEHVAHVFAATRADAAFALGWTHARHRGWQLEVSKRLVDGRLSELAGPAALERDKVARRLQLATIARREFLLLPPAEQRILQAYASGVNAGMPGDLPRLAWEGADCVGWSLYLALQLSGNWQSELDRMEIAGSLGEGAALLLLPGVPASPAAASFDPGSITAAAMPLHDATGSNAWAVTGDRSRSGKPLLANDPHLPMTVPSPWFFARISVSGEDPAERQDVIGATSPGLPMVLIGRTERVAWGMTRNGADTQDLYLEEVDPSNESRYRTATGWSEFERHVETIRVRGSDAVTIVVDASRHGPVIGEVRPSHAESGAEASQRIALRWTALQHAAGSISAAFNANRARNCGELVQSFRTHVAPVQNLIGADSAGRVCYEVVGRVPKRSPRQPGGGLFPVPGWHAGGEWLGWLAAADMPRASGTWVDANQAVPLPGAERLGGEWDQPHRFRRIHELLARKDRHDARDLQAMQYDTQSSDVAVLLPILLRTRAPDAKAATALSVLASFDGNMRAGSAAPLVYTAWVDELTRQVIGHRLGAARFGAMYGRRLFRPALASILGDRQQAKQWCRSADCAVELSASLQRAAEKIAITHGADPSEWRWGRAHAVEGYEVGGDPWTVSMTAHEPSSIAAMYPTRIAANARLVHDLADRNASWFVHFGDPDASVGSSVQRRFASGWQQGRYRELRFEPRAWLERFRLLPQG